MMRVTAWILLTTLAGCGPQPEQPPECDVPGCGTYVGNPELIMGLATSSEVVLTSATTTINSVSSYLKPPAIAEPDDVRRTVGPGEIDLLQWSGDLRIEPGAYTELELIFAEPLVLQGTSTRSGAIDIRLELPDFFISLGDSGLGEDRGYLIQFASEDWLNESSVGWDLSADQRVDSDSPVYEQLVQAMRTDTRVVEDLDGDGEISSGDREVSR